jgi:1,4-alpha-glucan branching enzyme
MSTGDFCLVLHGHLPWVLHHGNWPHGEVWLFEAAAETYLPLLSMLESCKQDQIPCPISLGLMPVLLEQLEHQSFKDGFFSWLQQRMQRAEADALEFKGRNELHLVWLAKRWQTHFQKLAEQFEAIQRDIPKAFAVHHREKRIELLTSNATHGFMPLLLHEASLKAQVRAGVHTSKRVLGFQPEGAWLPECAYQPGGPWTPPVVHGDSRNREGTEVFFAQEGIKFFIVDGQLLRNARSEGIQNGQFQKVSWERANQEPWRGWRQVLEPHAISSDGGPGRLTVLARHPEVSEQVWSGIVGYPGDGRYLEFHKKHGNDGLKYWKVTAPRVELQNKEPYFPEDTQAAVFMQAQHFVAVLRAILGRYHRETGRRGVICAPFDAELFGHWWHEGPEFLKEVFRALAATPEIHAATVSERLSDVPADKVVSLPAGSWGEGGDWRVWLNENQKWIWEAIYRAEDRFLELWHRLPWWKDPALREALTLAGRELLLLQASDWPFVIYTKGAVDYGYRRFCDHLARFDRVASVAEARFRGEPDSELAKHALQDVTLHDGCFLDLELEWWG